jgi:hypothetical protein
VVCHCVHCTLFSQRAVSDDSAVADADGAIRAVQTMTSALPQCAIGLRRDQEGVIGMDKRGDARNRQNWRDTGVMDRGGQEFLTRCPGWAEG